MSDLGADLEEWHSDLIHGTRSTDWFYLVDNYIERALKAEEELARLGKRFPVTIDKKTQVIVDRKAFDACMGEIAALREENDQQRHIIQQVVELREMLAKTLPIIGELAESIGYGYYKPEDPRDFTPDYECCSKTEISNWKNDCAKADAGKEIGDMRAWGIGTYKIKDPEMIELRDRIKQILSQSDPGAEIRKRLAKLEAVATVAGAISSGCYDANIWDKLKQALADLEGGHQ